MAPKPSPRLAAALQYMCDVRHTALGSLLVSAFKPAALKPLELQNTVACVTGGTAGVGLGIARSLCLAGAEVHVTGRGAERGAAAVSSAAGGPGSITFHQLDLSTREAAQQLDALMEKVLRGRPLDVLVQNLACMPDAHERVGSGDARHERTVSTNLLVFYELGQLLHPRMAAGGRSIAVVSAGLHLHRLDVPALAALDADADGASFDAVWAYCVTHRARALLARRWAAQQPALRFASVHPGWVDSAPHARPSNR